MAQVQAQGTSQAHLESDGEVEDELDARPDLTACLPGYSYEDVFMRRERTFPVQEGGPQLHVLQRFMELDGTAGTVWPVTEVFMREYRSLLDRGLWDVRDKGVLELGSGTGVLAMFLAYHHATRIPRGALSFFSLFQVLVTVT